MEKKYVDIVGISGSLRAGSFNSIALGLASKLLPDGIELDVIDWRSVPPFDADVLADGFPAEVMAARERVRRADGVLFATPEYNFSIPGMLKNSWTGCRAATTSTVRQADRKSFPQRRGRSAALASVRLRDACCCSSTEW